MKLLVLGLLIGSVSAAQAAKMAYDEALVPRFNVGHMQHPPTIDGTIGDDEWREATRVMGVVWTSSLNVRDRPVAFWVGWDSQHLYLAARSDILPGHRLYKASRETYTTGVVADDSNEFGIFLHDRNKKPTEVSSFFKFVLNSLGSGEYMRLYPAIGQNLYNWQPHMHIANRVYERDGRHWWDQEISISLADLQMTRPHQAGDPIDILLAADLKNPEWQWLDFPSASGHLEHYGFPRAVLTDKQPYAQVEEFSGFHDGKLHLRSVIRNPGPQPAKVDVSLTITWRAPSGKPEDQQVVVNKQATLTVPAGGAERFDVDETFPGLKYTLNDSGGVRNSSRLSLEMRPSGQSEAAPIYTWHGDFSGTNKDYLKAVPRTTVFDAEMTYNPVRNVLALAGDTLDARIPAGSNPTGMRWDVTHDGQTTAQGTVTQFVHYKYEDLVSLPPLPAGRYDVKLGLVDAQGTVLVSRDDFAFTKKDEPREFAEWWNNHIGDTEKVLQPFEALRVDSGAGVTVHCTRRSYRLDGLGLPSQITANGCSVLARPARIVVTVGGRELVVPVKGTVRFTSQKDWRLEFTGAPVRVAGLEFNSRGWMEQDGLVNIDLTYAPIAGPVAVQEMRVEWPVDDSEPNYMACIGVGSNYAARYIGAVPAGRGLIWDTLSAIGNAGSGMTVGNFYDNLWVGNDRRGLLWAADTDRGWRPSSDTPAHSLFREGGTLVLRNHLVGRAAEPLKVDAPRTVQLQYNASPFRNLAPGWRLTQVSAADGFTEKPKYKWNWDTGQEFFSTLSPPFADKNRWAEYYAYCHQVAEERSKEGYFRIAPRLGPYLTNQIALRGYERKTQEPGLYEYFGADWDTDHGESLNKSYIDYMVYLMNRQVSEGGCTHFYYDISMVGHSRSLAAGFGYRLPDGRVQPGGMCGTLRDWYKRAWAMMQENHLYPGGISGHSTNSISIKALPFTDSILDSEYPMQDPVDAYPSDRMIALSVPHTFGVQISHLGFMNPEWAVMHDAAAGGGGGPFWTTEFRQFGISRPDVQFVPYWRNAAVVKHHEPGVIASIWHRQGAAIVAVMNYGPDPSGKERSRSGALTLDLQALGVRARPKPGQVRISELYSGPRMVQGRYLGQYRWVQDLPVDPKQKDWDNGQKPAHMRASIAPTIDVANGRVGGFDVFYHDVRYLLITWDESFVPRERWNGVFDGRELDEALAWGINRPQTSEVSHGIEVQSGGVNVRGWQQPAALLLSLSNPGAKAMDAIIQLDLGALGLKVEKLWTQFLDVQGGVLDPVTGALKVHVEPGQPTIVRIIRN